MVLPNRKEKGKIKKQISSNINITTLPNLITILRIILTPLFVIFMLKDEFGFALIFFLVAAISDGLDGFLARYLNQHTELGAYLDPIADKMLLAASFITLAIRDAIPNWLTVIVISRDIIILLGVAICNLIGVQLRMKPSVLSKITTVTQIITVLLALLRLNHTFMDTLQIVFYWVTAIFTTLSGVHYLFKGMNLIQQKK